MSKKVLEIKNLTKYYKSFLAVEDISFSLLEGETFGLIGPNGAGKSTTIRCIMSLINKNKGDILINGKSINKDDLELKNIIGYLPSEIHLYGDYTVKKMFDFHESHYQKEIHDRRINLVKRFHIDENKKIEDLSLGNMKKVGIVLAFMHDPQILILDEATSGLDPIMQQEFYRLVKEEQEKNKTILYSTHILSEIERICDKVAIIQHGHILKISDIDTLKKNSLINVTITSKDKDKIKKDFKEENIQDFDNKIKFSTILSGDKLITKLSKYKIDKILIEEASLEEVFLKYYK